MRERTRGRRPSFFRKCRPKAGPRTTVPDAARNLLSAPGTSFQGVPVCFKHAR